MEVVVTDYRTFELDDSVCGALVQYPNTEGTIEDYTALLEQANQNEVSQYCYRIGRIFHFINFQLKWYVEINKNHLNFAPKNNSLENKYIMP